MSGFVSLTHALQDFTIIKQTKGADPILTPHIAKAGAFCGTSVLVDELRRNAKYEHKVMKRLEAWILGAISDQHSSIPLKHFEGHDISELWNQTRNAQMQKVTDFVAKCISQIENQGCDNSETEVYLTGGGLLDPTVKSLIVDRLAKVLPNIKAHDKIYHQERYVHCQPCACFHIRTNAP